MLGDSVTTDHISPAGSIPADSPAGKYLISKGVAPRDFNSYGARRGNHEVMMRGTFANIRLRNQLAPGTEGGWTTLLPEGEVMTIYDASVAYRERGVPLMIIAGKEYGSGSSRDWAAKGTLLLGVKAVHRRELRADPSQQPGEHGRAAAAVPRPARTRVALKLTGRESFDVVGIGPAADAGAARSRSARRRRTAPCTRSSPLRASTRPKSSSPSVTEASCRTCCGSCSGSRRGAAGRPEHHDDRGVDHRPRT